MISRYDNSNYLEEIARIDALYQLLRNEDASSKLFINKELNRIKREFLFNLKNELNKPDAMNKPIEYHLLFSANGNALSLYKSLTGKRVNQLVSSLLPKHEEIKSPRDYLLYKLIDGKAGIYHPPILKPDRASGEHYYNMAHELARKEVAELGLLSSNELKMNKIDILCQIIPILKNYQTDHIENASEQIRNQLFEAIKRSKNQDEFKRALKGKRVKELILKVTGEPNVASLLNHLDIYLKTPAPTDQNKEVVNNTIKDYNKELGDILNTASRLISSGALEDAKQLIQEQCINYDTIADRYIPKSEVGYSILAIDMLDNEGMKQRSMYATQLSTLYKMHSMLDNDQSNESKEKSQVYESASEELRSNIPGFTQAHDQAFNTVIKCMYKTEEARQSIENVKQRPNPSRRP